MLFDCRYFEKNFVLKDSIPWSSRRLPIWPGTPAQFRRLWDKALETLQIGHLRLLPSGLRGGGACYHMIQHEQNLSRTRRRGRWMSERTLEHYLQHPYSLMALQSLTSAQLRIIDATAALSESLFAPRQL